MEGKRNFICKLLGVKNKVSEEELKTIYIKEIKKIHPDKVNSNNIDTQSKNKVRLNTILSAWKSYKNHNKFKDVIKREPIKISKRPSKSKYKFDFSNMFIDSITKSLYDLYDKRIIKDAKKFNSIEEYTNYLTTNAKYSKNEINNIIKFCINNKLFVYFYILILFVFSMFVLICEWIL
jgi:curved DNA-binding protein CbpA